MPKMPKIDKNTVFYDLTSSQEVVNLQLKFCIFKEVMNIVVCTYISQQVDIELLKKAINIEIERNDTLRLYFKKVGKKLMQFFAEPYKLDNIPVIDFAGKTKDEQDSFLKKDASKPVRFKKGELFRFIILKTYDGKTAIYFAVCHMNMDASSVFMLMNNLLEIYKALNEKTEMPKPYSPYSDYIQRDRASLENSKKLGADEQFFRDLYLKNGEPVYCGVQGIGPLLEMRKKRKNPNLRSYPMTNPLHDKSANIKYHLNSDFAKRMDDYCMEKKTNPLSLIQLAMRTYLSKINNLEEDVVNLTVCGRRATLADKNSSGCLAGFVPVRTIIKADTGFADAVDECSTQLSQSFRHSNYPGIKTLAILHNAYNTPYMDAYASMLISFLPFLPPDGWDIECEWISNGRFAMFLYVVIVRSPKDNGYDIYYEYRIRELNAKQISALHEGLTEIIKIGIDNPEMTIGDIIKQTNN
jgi:hypothetical protein